MFFLGCGSQKLSSLPDYLIGEWRTSAQKYSDSFFILKKSTATFGTDGISSEAYPIRRIVKEQQNNKLIYTLFYQKDDKAIYEMSFYYDHTDGSIRLKNQSTIVWEKIT